MSPPPRPPIICYDLRTNENSRPCSYSVQRIPTTSSTIRKPKVTIVRRSPLTCRTKVVRKPTIPYFQLESPATRDISSECNILPPIQHNHHNTSSRSMHILPQIHQSHANTSSKSVSVDLDTSVQMYQATPKKHFSFYKYNPEAEDTVEVDDMDFFEKVEDKTMIEVNELLGRMQNVLKDMKR